MMILTGARSAVLFINAIAFPIQVVLHMRVIQRNYFHLQHTTDLVIDVEISHAQIINPTTGQIESWLGVLPKSKYDGVGLRQPIDIALTLDISIWINGRERIALAKHQSLNCLEYLIPMIIYRFRDLTMKHTEYLI